MLFSITRMVCLSTMLAMLAAASAVTQPLPGDAPPYPYWEDPYWEDPTGPINPDYQDYGQGNIPSDYDDAAIADNESGQWGTAGFGGVGPSPRSIYGSNRVNVPSSNNFGSTPSAPPILTAPGGIRPRPCGYGCAY